MDREFMNYFAIFVSWIMHVFLDTINIASMKINVIDKKIIQKSTNTCKTCGFVEASNFG